MKPNNDEQPHNAKKQDWTKTLPTDPDGKSVVDDMLTAEGARAFAATSTSSYRLFNDQKAPGHRLSPILLQSVARGEQNKAASILTSRSDLLSHRGDVTDYSGRIFKKYHGFSICFMGDGYTHVPHDIGCNTTKSYRGRIACGFNTSV